MILRHTSYIENRQRDNRKTTREKARFTMENTMRCQATRGKIIKTFLVIALPIALQNLLTYAVNLMDSIMVGALGEVQLSAVTVANQPFFLFMMFMSGLSAGACVLIAQYWGKGDSDTISKVFGIVIRIALALGIAVSVAVMAFPRLVMSLYTDEPQIIDYGVEYLRVVIFSYVPFAVTYGYLTCLRSVERVHIAVATYSVSFCVNVFFNYMFIFGKFGAPALGVTGAGVGTVIARATELLIVLFYAHRLEKRVSLNWQYILHNEKWLLRDFTKITIPALVNQMTWAVGASVHNAILGRISVSAVATISIVSTVFQIVTVFIYGASSATQVIVGKQIGEKQLVLARNSANWLVAANILIAAVTAAVFLLFKNAIIGFYSITPETRDALHGTMIVTAAVILIFSVNMACIVGVFRGGGDTKYAMYLDIFAVWCVAIPLGLLGAFVWALPIPLVYFLLRSDELVKAFLCLIHLRSGKWLRVVTRNANGTESARLTPLETG